MREASYSGRVAHVPVRRAAPRRPASRTAIPKKRKAGVRRGRVVDKPYVEFMHQQMPACQVAGKRSESPCSGIATYHHVRHKINPDGTTERISKDDRRGIKLCEAHHIKGNGPHAIHEMTAPGAWESFFGICIEETISGNQEAYAASRVKRKA